MNIGIFRAGDDLVMPRSLPDHGLRIEGSLHPKRPGPEVKGGPGDPREGRHGPFEPRGAIRSGEAGQMEGAGPSSGMHVGCKHAAC
jgi:hypothetical protein